LTKHLSERFYSPKAKPFLQKGSQCNEGEYRGKEKIEEKAFQNWQCIIWDLFLTLNQFFLGCRKI